MKNILLLLTGTLFCCVDSLYQPNWESLDSRPIPEWYDQAKFGIFLTWGIYSVPSYGSEWFWWNWKGSKNPKYVEFMEKNYPPDFTYADFAPLFKAEMFDPDEWADLFQLAGAQYIVITTKHHGGWTNWPSKTSWNWNSVDNGPHRDLIGDLANSVRSRTSIHFGLYFSLFEWFNPLYLNDKAAKFTTNSYVKEVSTPQLYEIINAYKPDVLFSDGDWEAPDTYWNSTNFLAWLYNESPVKDKVVVNDRWGIGTHCHHGGYYNCKDRYNPGVLQKHKWENCMTVDKKSWGYRREARLEDYLTTADLIKELVITVSCGGNLLLNVGPTHDGRIVPVFQERLLDIGRWLSINKEAIYNTTTWPFQNDSANPNFWYTTNAETKAVYGILVNVFPVDYNVTIGSVLTLPETKISLLGYGDVKWGYAPNMHDWVCIYMPHLPLDSQLKWAWVFKFEHINPGIL